MRALVIPLVIIGVVLFAVFAFRSKRKNAHPEQISVAAQDGRFSIMRGDMDGHALFATIDMGLRDFRDRQKLPFFLSVSTPLNQPTSEGLPTRTDATNLNAWEDAVEARLRSQSKYVFIGRVTWNSNRELLYYVDSQQPAAAAIKALSEGHSTRPFAFICERDETWQHARFWLDRD